MLRIPTKPLIPFAAALALVLVPAAPASADGLAGVSGWEPVPDSCGGPSIFPVLVTNATNAPQTGSITIGPGLSAQVQVFPTYQAVMASEFGYLSSMGPGDSCPGRPEIMSAPAYQAPFTVQPAQTSVWWMAAGGLDYNLIDDTHNIAIGGLPSGTAGQSWYDFNLSLNADESFVQLQLEYQGTGGINTDNGQNGFNVVACDSGGGNVSTTDTIISPYSSSVNSSVTYGFATPICLGWFPTGTMMPTSSADVMTNDVVASVTAVQFNPTGNTLNMQGTLVSGVTNVNIGAGENWLTSGLGASGGSYLYGDGQFLIEGAPVSCNQVDIVFAARLNGSVEVNDTIEVTNIPSMPTCSE